MGNRNFIVVHTEKLEAFIASYEPLNYYNNKSLAQKKRNYRTPVPYTDDLKMIRSLSEKPFDVVGIIK